MISEIEGMDVSEIKRDNKGNTHVRLELSGDYKNGGSAYKKSITNRALHRRRSSIIVSFNTSDKENMRVSKVTKDDGDSDEERDKSSSKEVERSFAKDGFQALCNKECVARFIDHNCFQLFMLLVTIYALFGDDMRLLAFMKAADGVFMILNCIALGLFTVEICLQTYAKPEYFNSFFFWLDIISTLSIVTDIGPIWDEITGQGSGSETNAADAGQLARASRGARIGTKAGRVTRVIRLIRLIRIVKLYKSANQAMSNDEKTGNVKELKSKMAMSVKSKSNELAEKDGVKDPDVADMLLHDTNQ